MRNKMLSILLTFCFLFSLAFPTLTAHADDEVEYQNLYFFTDAPDLYSEKRNAINQAMQQTGSSLNFISTDLSSYGDTSFEEFNNAASNIQDSIVIVELTSRMPIPPYQPPTLPTQHLYDAFSTLKSNNCKIIFISGNSELTYQSSVALLDFVDVHINVDFIYYLVSAIIAKIGMNQDDDNFYFVTDGFFVDTIDERNDFTHRWLLPYFKEIYGLEYYSYVEENNKTDSDLLFFNYLSEYNCINFYGQSFRGSSQVFNYRAPSTSFFMDFDVDNPYTNGINRAYMIGYKNVFSYSNDAWYRIVNRLVNELADRVFVAEFYASAYGDDSDVNSMADLLTTGINRLMFYEGGYTPAEGIYCLREIVADFLADADMQKYNNLTAGRCEITYMPIIISADGWIPTNLVLDCFQVDT